MNMNLNADTMVKILDTAFITPTNKETMLKRLGLTNPRYYRLRKKWIEIKENASKDDYYNQLTQLFDNIPAKTLLVIMSDLDLSISDLYE